MTNIEQIERLVKDSNNVELIEVTKILTKCLEDISIEFEIRLSFNEGFLVKYSNKEHIHNFIIYSNYISYSFQDKNNKNNNSENILSITQFQNKLPEIDKKHINK